MPATFELCEEIVAPGGIIANVGVHGHKVDLHLETLWSKNISITTRLVDTVTTPMLLKDGAVEETRSDPADHASVQPRTTSSTPTTRSAAPPIRRR